MRSLLLLILLVPALCQAQIAPNVINVTPAPHAVGIDRNADIIVEFDTTVSVTSVSNSSFRVFGRWSGPIDGSFTMSNSNQTARFSPDNPYMSGERITVMLSTDIRSPVQLLSQDLAQAWSWTFWVESNPIPTQHYPLDTISVRRTSEGWIQSYGAYAGDVNEDGHTDLAVINEQAADVRFFMNDGLGNYDNFTDVTLPDASLPSPNEAGDFNNDDHIDLAVGSTGNNTMAVLNGDGTGPLAFGANYGSGNNIRGLDVLDMNQDAMEDIVTANKGTDDVAILLNDGTGLFLPPVQIDPGGTGKHALAAGDMNNDGLRDIIYGAHTSEEFYILLSDGAGGLTASDTTPARGKPWMIATGDVNLDGFLDIASANSDSNVVAIAFGDGAGRFTNVVTYPVGQFPLAIDLGDLDGDGDLDFISSNFSSADFTFMENDGSGNFGNTITYGALSAGSCAIFHDRNTDGDLDITLIDELDDVILTLDDDSTLAFIGIEDQLLAPPTVTVSPNPFRDELKVSIALQQSERLEIVVMDLAGRPVLTLPQIVYQRGNHALELVLPETSATGVYLLSVRSENHRVVKRVAHLE